MSATEGKPVRIALVDEGPQAKFAIDIMGAYCLLSEVSSLFTINADLNGQMITIDNNTIKFPFKDAKYDYVNGAVPGYSPSAVLPWVTSNPNQLYKGLKSTPFKRYFGAAKAGPKNNLGHSMVRVRFFIDPANRERAERIAGKKLPDDLFKANYNGETVQIGSNFAFANNLPPNASIWERIYNSGVNVSKLLLQRAAQYPGRKLYGADGRNLVKVNDGDGFIVKSKFQTDCSGGSFWILVNAGIVLPQGDAMWPPNTGYMRAYKNGWPSKIKLAPGIKAVPVPIDSVQPGDLILWDRNKDSNNHLLIYAGPGKKFDFGCDASCKKQQPLSGSHKQGSPPKGGYGAWRFVPDGTQAVAATSNDGAAAAPAAQGGQQTGSQQQPATT